MGFWELPEDEQPPERIWGDDDKLIGWFEEMKAVREKKYGGGQKAEHLEEVPLMENELTDLLEVPSGW